LSLPAHRSEFRAAAIHHEHDVERAKGGLEFPRHPLQIGSATDIRLDGEYTVCKLLLGLVVSPDTSPGDGNPGTVLQEQPGGRKADPARSAGDASRLSLQYHDADLSPAMAMP
jgi:hypothetical protein